MVSPVLVVFSGLPGVGKTTLAKEVAKRLGAVYLRADTIEQAMVAGGVPADELDGKGYEVGYALALENLALGRNVVCDSVNPWEMTRRAWVAPALDLGVPYVNVEVACSDEAEHRRRVETRTSDIPGHVPPTWKEVLERDYVPWTTPRVVVDTAGATLEDGARAVLAATHAL